MQDPISGAGTSTATNNDPMNVLLGAVAAGQSTAPASGKKAPARPGRRSTPAAPPASDAVTAAIYKAADELGVPRALALAIAQHESGLNPTNQGDRGFFRNGVFVPDPNGPATSFGLFQLHQGGELGSLTPQEAMDPYTNAKTALSVVAQVMKQHPDWSPGQIAAAAQRPQDMAGYAATINTTLGHPGAPSAPSGSGSGVPGDTGSTAPLTPAFDPNASVSINSYGWIAALAHKVPDLNKLMAKYANEDLSSSGVQARLEADIKNTKWFQTTTDAQRQSEILQATNPSEYLKQFRDTQSKVSQMAQQIGVTLPGLQSHDFAANALNLGWTDDEIKRYLLAEGQKATAGQIASGQVTPGALQTTGATLRQQANDYLVPLSPQAYDKWAQDITAGRATTGDFDTYLKTQAKSLFPSMGAAIDRGVTPNQYLDPYRQYAAKILEMNPDSIDFAHNPTFGKAVFQVDPKTGERTAMSLADWQTYLRGLPQYQQTAQAKDQAAQFGEQIAQEFGKVSY